MTGYAWPSLWGRPDMAERVLIVEDVGGHIDAYIRYEDPTRPICSVEEPSWHPLSEKRALRRVAVRSARVIACSQ